MRRFFLIAGFTFSLVLTSNSYGGLGGFFQKLLKPVLQFSEKMLGQAIAASVKLQYGEWKPDPETKAFVEGVFSKITSVAERSDIKWSLTILKPGFVNAFAVPGGHIYITRGLLAKIKTDDELAAVLGHEVGHVVAKHSMNSIKHQVAYQFIINQLNKRSDKLKSLGQIYSVFAGLRYSRKNEHEADYYGARYAALAGYNPSGMVDFLKILKKVNPREPNQIETSIRSHPPTSRRINRMEEYMASFPEAGQRSKVLSFDYSSKYPAKASTDSATVESTGKTEVLTDAASSSGSGVEIYFQTFDDSEEIGIAKGLKIANNSGLYVLDSTTKYKGKASQRLSSYKQASLGLITAPIKVKPDTKYKLRVFVKVRGVEAENDPIGHGACLNITELSARQFLGSYSGLFSITGTSEKFEELAFEFKTRSKTSVLTVEFAFRKAIGQAWFDDFLLQEL